MCGGGPPAWSTLFSASSGDYSCIETFQHVATASRAGIKVLLWRGGVKAERCGVKDGRAVASAKVSGVTITAGAAPTKKTGGGLTEAGSRVNIQATRRERHTCNFQAVSAPLEFRVQRFVVGQHLLR